MQRTPHTNKRRHWMVRLLFFLGIMVLLTATACREPAQKKSDDRSLAAPGEVLIKFKAGVPEDSINALAARLGLEKVRELSAIGVNVYRTTSRFSVQQVIDASKINSHLIEYAEPNVKYRIPEKNQN